MYRIQHLLALHFNLARARTTPPVRTRTLEPKIAYIVYRLKRLRSYILRYTLYYYKRQYFFVIHVDRRRQDKATLSKANLLYITTIV